MFNLNEQTVCGYTNSITLARGIPCTLCDDVNTTVQPPRLEGGCMINMYFDVEMDALLESLKRLVL